MHLAHQNSLLQTLSAKWISLKAECIKSHNQWNSSGPQLLISTSQLWHAYLSILYYPHSVYQQNLFRLKNTFGLASKVFAGRNKIEMLWMNHTKRQPWKWYLHQGRMQHPCAVFIYVFKILKASQFGPVLQSLFTHSRLAEYGKKIRETNIITSRCHHFCRSV